MSPSRLFILRPVATSLLMLAILLAGIIAYRVLPLSALPEVDYPTIQVVTLYPGASPDVVTSSITAPLERQFGQMPGLNQMSSINSGGASVITLQFSLELSLDIAEQEGIGAEQVEPVEDGERIVAGLRRRALGLCFALEGVVQFDITLFHIPVARRIHEAAVGPVVGGFDGVETDGWRRGVHGDAPESTCCECRP